MKFKFSIIFLIILFMGCEEPAVQPPKEPYVLNLTDTSTIVCLGDSLTSGFGIGAENSYPAHLQNKVNINVINSGISGETTADALARMATDVIAHDPAIVVIQLGANDLQFNVNPATVKANFLNIIDTIKNNNENTLIYIAKFLTLDMIMNSGESVAGITINDQTKLLLHAAYLMYDEIAAVRDVVLLETFWTGVWGVNSMMLDDGVHPSDAGALQIAENMYSSMEDVLIFNELVK